MRELFLLDPDVVFLNHGSYGACPRPVFGAYQRYQLELERQPVAFFIRSLPERIDAVRERLAAYVGADAAGLVLVSNATTGINMAARSLDLQPGDEIVASDREYGAVDILWRFVCEKTGARYLSRPPEQLWDACTERTRVLCLSHVTSPTAEILPVEELCARAREAGILTIVDGAHAPGQLPLDLEALGADAYAGNCHKWMCAPKGAGFLLVREGLRDRIEPSIVSWDWERETEFAARHRWMGTRDPAAFLAIPDAIDFMAEHDWDAVRACCRELATKAHDGLAALGLTPFERPYAQMVALELPPCDPERVQQRLLEEHHIEIPCRDWNDRPLIRASFQAYNDERDVERLVDGLPRVLD